MIRKLITTMSTGILASLLLAAPSHAQTGQLTGVVTAADDGQPIGNAVITVTNAAGVGVASVYSGQDGRYVVRGLAPGQYSVVAQPIGYGASDATQVTVTANGTATADFALARSSEVRRMDPISVSAGRREQAADKAPASTHVFGRELMDARAITTPIDPLKSIAAVHLISMGIQSSAPVARGFNNIFSGALLTLTDYRLASVPSLRVNLMHFVPANTDDIEQLEVVLGPGSALYGPNTANGVLHLLTKDPLQEQGTVVGLTGGEQSLLQGNFRTAHRLSERFAFKLSGQYLSADEWEYLDPVEAQTRALYASNPAFWQGYLAGINEISETEAGRWIERVGTRNFDVRRFAGEARADWRVTDQLRTTWTVGTTMIQDAIEPTGLGAAQAKDWRYSFYQVRGEIGSLFGQLYLNTSDAGDTYLLRTGTPITDRSKLMAAQLQNVTSLGNRQLFTYGADLFLTMPETEGTINGIYEDDDETTEFGAFLQSETALTPQLDLILTGRVDTHSALPDAIFSPRAGLVYGFGDGAFRVTYNRAFSTPTSLNQFLDLSTAVPAAEAAQLGYSVRVQGTGENGFSFRQGDGSYLMRSPFTPGPAGPSTLVPAVAAPFWAAAVQVLTQAGAIGNPQLAAYLAALQPTPADIRTNWSAPLSNITEPIAELTLDEIAPIRESTTSTVEVGYRGLLGDRHSLAVDLWYTKRNDFVTPLTTFTPFILLNGQDVGAYLVPRLIADLGMSQEEALATATLLAEGLATVPLGVVSSQDVHSTGPQLLASYTNFDDAIDLYGIDINASLGLTDNWRLNPSLSLINDVTFESDEGLLVALNSPKTQAALGLAFNSLTGFTGELRGRYNDEFPVQSGVYEGTACIDDTSTDPCVESYTLFDLALGYTPPSMPNVTVQFNVQNLADEEYRSYPGVPAIGRLAVIRLRYELGGS